MQAELQQGDVFGPWERTKDPDVVRQFLTAAGVPKVELTVEEEELSLLRPEAWWEIVLGTGMRKWVMSRRGSGAIRSRATSSSSSTAGACTPVLLVWDRSGFVLYYKRLEKGTFEVPEAKLGEHLTWPQLMLILEGVSLDSARYRKRYTLPERQKKAA